MYIYMCVFIVGYDGKKSNSSCMICLRCPQVSSRLRIGKSNISPIVTVGGVTEKIYTIKLVTGHTFILQRENCCMLQRKMAAEEGAVKGEGSTATDDTTVHVRPR